MIKDTNIEEKIINDTVLEVFIVVNFEKSDEILEEQRDLLQKLYTSLQLKIK